MNMRRVAADLRIRVHRCALAVVWAMTMSPAYTAEVSEYNVKAGYLLLFTRYVQWPEAAFEDANAPLTIAVLGDDPFGRVLDETMRDQVSQGRHLRVVRARTLEELPPSHVVFVSRREPQRRDWLEALLRRPILTVMDSSDPAGEHSIVQFVVEQSNVRFTVSRDAAKRAQLEIRTPMLLAAQARRDAPPDSPPATQSGERR
jgi:hypothetical protein